MALNPPQSAAPATLLASRAVIRLTAREPGEDIRGFLQGLVTNDVTGTLPVWAGLLTPQGKALFDFIVWADGDDLLIDCEDSAADALIKRLSLYRLRRAIDIARDPALGVHWQPGPGPTPDPRLPALGQRWIGTNTLINTLINTGSSADAAWLAHRLAHGVAEGRGELGDGETLWLEANAAELAGVSFTKGCYVGQENTARMNWRQKVNRRLVVVPIAASKSDRQRAAYPQLGWAIDHWRVEDIAGDVCPAWLQSA
jgi:folate-binding protein YgfZ